MTNRLMELVSRKLEELDKFVRDNQRIAVELKNEDCIEMLGDLKAIIIEFKNGIIEWSIKGNRK